MGEELARLLVSVPNNGTAEVPFLTLISAKDRYWNRLRDFNEQVILSTNGDDISPTVATLRDGFAKVWITLIRVGDRPVRATCGDVTGEDTIHIVPGQQVQLTTRPTTLNVSASRKAKGFGSLGWAQMRKL